MLAISDRSDQLQLTLFCCFWGRNFSGIKAKLRSKLATEAIIDRKNSGVNGGLSEKHGRNLLYLENTDKFSALIYRKKTTDQFLCHYTRNIWKLVPANSNF